MPATNAKMLTNFAVRGTHLDLAATLAVAASLHIVRPVSVSAA